MLPVAQLFLTCLTEQFFPDALEKMVALLERLNVQVEFPSEQTCCGQPFYNSGFQSNARDVARHWLKVFGETSGYIIAPSGSCVHMVRHQYPELFPEGTAEHARAKDAAARTFEITEFLVRESKITNVGARFPHKVAYHASCHLLRGLGVRDEPKQLLSATQGLELTPLVDEETCCGFGGTFSVVYPEVSQAILQTKIRNIEASGAEVIVACDAGCLMNIRGGLRRSSSHVKAMHLVEILGSSP